MTPDETLLFKDKKESVTNEWYEMMMSAIIPSRALRLGRPVFKTEFFGLKFLYFNIIIIMF